MTRLILHAAMTLRDCGYRDEKIRTATIWQHWQTGRRADGQTGYLIIEDAG